MTFEAFLTSYQKVPVVEYPNQVPKDTAQLTIKVMTYNHAKYIRQCLDSILMQQTSFDFYILLGEDESNDGTREICIEYAKKYPAKIRLLLQSRKNNIAINEKPSGLFNSTYCNYLIKTKYVAFCEGDDYWRDTTALQQQVNFLERNEEYSFCFYDAIWVDAKDNLLKNTSLQKKEHTYTNRTTKDLLTGCTIPNLTKVYRNNLISIYEEGMKRIVCGDLIQFGKLSQFGDGKYLTKIIPAAYRIHEGGIYSQASIVKQLQNNIIAREYLLEFSSKKSVQDIHACLSHLYWKLFFFTIWLKQRIDTRLLQKALFNSRAAKNYSVRIIGKVLWEIIERKIIRLQKAEKHTKSINF